MRRLRHPGWSFLPVVALLIATSAPAGGGPLTNVTFALLDGLRAAQEQQYGEREVLDPQTDEWVAEAATPEGAPSDELSRARALLATGEIRKARKLLDKWIEQNPDHERYYEGVFLYGEAQFEFKDYYKAYEQYEVVVENTAGELFRQALMREKDVALAFLSGQKRIVWRIFRLPARDEAIEILDRIWERVPGTRLGEDALRTKADYFYSRGEMDIAQDEYAHLAREYPAGRFVQYAMLRSAESAEAAFPGIKFDARPLLEAEERYRQVQHSFPAYAERENVPQRLEGIRQLRAEKDLDIARWYERVRQPGAAEFYYRAILKDWPDTLAAADARQRLRALGVDVETEAREP
ncbi:MAG: outer membrane protein assembly factor BamD [Phycisphaerae bacterium]|jgi:outer membrane protein assembly factor BamD (BamD/ComL family)